MHTLRMTRRGFISFTLASLAAGANPPESPNRPVRLVVPSPSGGTGDFTAQLVAPGLESTLGQPVVVDTSLAGSAGTRAGLFVSQAAPDGHTLLVSYSGYHVGTPHLYPGIDWHPLKDFAPVSMLSRAPQLLVVGAHLKVSTMREFLELVRKRKPGQVTFASSGAGSVQHIAGELFQQLTRTQLTHIEYRGAGPAAVALLSGEVDMMMTTPPSVIESVRSRKLVALAVTDTVRQEALPDVPTMAEVGLAELDLDSWFAMYAPASTPPAVVRRLNRSLGIVLRNVDLIAKAAARGLRLEPSTPEALAAHTRSEFERWGQIIRTAKITVK